MNTNHPLQVGEAILSTRGGRQVIVEFSIQRGEFQKFFGSILEATAWCKENALKII